MSVVISFVDKKSIAEKKRIKAGDTLVSINGNPINDVLDYDFYVAEYELELELIQKSRKKTIHVSKDEYENLGLEFETYLIDRQRSCRNKCMFCFVDQMPKGMRETLYFKDDDSRLSFLFGNYITLTNMDRTEIDRIIKMHISPINISVHTTNPELRIKMMSNKNAGDVLKFIPLLVNASISINCQLVLCNGINDGQELKRSLNDLANLYPGVASIACVPVGLTKYREGLSQLLPYDKATASEVIDIIEEFSQDFYQKNGVRLAYPADEFFIKAGREIPSSDYYGDFGQLENGVGLVASLRDDYLDLLKQSKINEKPRNISLATGVDAAPFMQYLVDETNKKCHNLNCRVIAIENEFFGKTITVAGLVTGQDLISQLEKQELGEELLIPACMLRNEQDKFLDDITLEQTKKKLAVKIRVVENDPDDLYAALCGEKE
ncbi:MAG: DUF512 domain-containing protein [Oscillospiraceae bacterium]